MGENTLILASRSRNALTFATVPFGACGQLFPSTPRAGVEGEAALLEGCSAFFMGTRDGRSRAVLQPAQPRPLPCPSCLLHLFVARLRGGAEISWQDHGGSVEMSLVGGKMGSAHEHCSHLPAPCSTGGGLGVQQPPLLAPCLCLGTLKTFRNCS